RSVVVVRLTARLHMLSSCPLEQPAGIEWILEEGVTTGPPRKPRADIYNLRSPDENWRRNMRGVLWKEKNRPCAFMKVKIWLNQFHKVIVYIA
ncbi:hypothetical protein EGK_16294, partial [Macaca mulatta]